MWEYHFKAGQRNKMIVTMFNIIQEEVHAYQARLFFYEPNLPECLPSNLKATKFIPITE